MLVAALSASDPVDARYGGAGEHPILSFQLISARSAPRWVRLEGSGATADAFDPASVEPGDASLTVIHDREATSEAAVSSRAASALRRALMVTPRAELRIPLDAARQLWDVVEVTDPAAGLAGQGFRVIGIKTDCRRGPRGARHESTLLLGGL